MLLASPQAGASVLLRDVKGVIAAGLPAIVTTSGGCAKDWKTPATVLPSLDADSVKLKGPLQVSEPSLDQRCSILPGAGSSEAMALLPLANSLKRIFLSRCQASQ